MNMLLSRQALLTVTHEGMLLFGFCPEVTVQLLDRRLTGVG